VQAAGLLGPEGVRIEPGSRAQRGLVNALAGHEAHRWREAVLLQQLLEPTLELSPDRSSNDEAASAAWVLVVVDELISTPS
jgi:hypothetical protein